MVNSWSSQRAHILTNNWEIINTNEQHCIVFLCYLLEKYWEMCSFSENVARRLTQNFPEELVNYNKSFLSRIYPAGKRVDSSNYNPQEMWNCGCQMGKFGWNKYFIMIIMIAMITKTNKLIFNYYCYHPCLNCVILTVFLMLCTNCIKLCSSKENFRPEGDLNP